MKLLRRRPKPALHILTEILEFLEANQEREPDLVADVAEAVDELHRVLDRDGLSSHHIVKVKLDDGDLVYGFEHGSILLYALPQPDGPDLVVTLAMVEERRDITKPSLPDKLTTYIDGLRNDPLTSIKEGAIQERISDELEELLKS